MKSICNKNSFGPKIFQDNYYFWSIWIWVNFLSKKVCLVQRYLRYKIILGSTEFWVKKILGPQKLWIQSYFPVKKKMIQKNLRPNKKLSPKNIGTKNLFVQKKSKMFESNIIVVQKNLGPENLLPSKIGYSNA